MNPPTITRSTSPQLRTFLHYLAIEAGLAVNTIHAYRRDLEITEDYLTLHGMQLATATPDQYREFIRDQSSKGLSTSTVTRRVEVLRVFLKFIGRLDGDQLDRPKPAEPLPRVLSRQQVLTLLAAPQPGKLLYHRDVAILELLYASGLRASELCDLSVHDISLDSVRVMGKGSKERLVPMNPVASKAIAVYLIDGRPAVDKHQSKALFLSRTGRPLCRHGLWYMVKAYAEKAGLPADATTHTLRHSFATHLISGGADLRVVQELLGHEDIQTTQIYTHVDADRLKAVHTAFHPRP